MFKKWLKNDNLLVSYRMTGATMLQYFSRRHKSIPRGIHVLARSLHVFPKYGCDELVQLWTAMHGFLACIPTHATTTLPLQLTAKDHFAYPMRCAGSVQSARDRVGLSLASVLQGSSACAAAVLDPIH